MLKVNELRIANWVMMAGEPYFIRAGEFIDDYSDQMKGMALTPEILLGCGFKYQDRDTNRHEPTRFYISPYFGRHREYWLEMNFPHFEGGPVCWWLNWNVGAGLQFIHLPDGSKILHLHELQNLFFVLSAGSELQIEEKIFRELFSF